MRTFPPVPSSPGEWNGSSLSSWKHEGRMISTPFHKVLDIFEGLTVLLGASVSPSVNTGLENKGCEGLPSFKI